MLERTPSFLGENFHPIYRRNPSSTHIYTENPERHVVSTEKSVKCQKYQPFHFKSLTTHTHTPNRRPGTRFNKRVAVFQKWGIVHRFLTEKGSKKNIEAGT